MSPEHAYGAQDLLGNHVPCFPKLRKDMSSLEDIMHHLAMWTENLCSNQGLAVALWPNQGRGHSGRQMAVGQSQDKWWDSHGGQGRGSPRPSRVVLSLVSPHSLVKHRSSYSHLARERSVAQKGTSGTKAPQLVVRRWRGALS